MSFSDRQCTPRYPVFVKPCLRKNSAATLLGPENRNTGPAGVIIDVVLPGNASVKWVLDYTMPAQSQGDSYTTAGSTDLVLLLVWYGMVWAGMVDVCDGLGKNYYSVTYALKSNGG